MAMSDPNTYLVDDADARVRYSAGWEQMGGDNEYNQTTHYTFTAGASFTFSFVGTSVSVFGTIDNLVDSEGRSPNSTYELDGTTPVVFRGRPVQGVIYQQLFYQSPTLPNMPHTLVGRSADAGSRIFIDFLAVTAPPVTSTTLQPTSQSATSSVTSSNTETATIAVGSGSSLSSNNIGAIVGGVVGGLALLAILLILTWWFTRRRTKIQTMGQMAEHQVHPFVAPIIPSNQSDTRSDLPIRSSMTHTPQQEFDPAQLWDPASLAYAPSHIGGGTTASLSPPSMGDGASSYFPAPVTSTTVGPPLGMKGGTHLTHAPSTSVATSARSDVLGDAPPPAYDS
ncbi:hypothetical protein PC9H_011542 [Pleurotus ostreatus]|uniref:Transmembrane protein n=1 Tax=Pleurotus ostreatus TaxID=5322 RepID=A0A8H6ZLA3_PLEOS|nr:uncharacterized protein PC9H_011542 [Pleurotus ostreatus]KAF7421023.1 hypothetical protein PC9H_011542 [Pleurotus ostreatus]